MRIEKNIPIELNSGHAIRIDERSIARPFSLNSPAANPAEQIEYRVCTWGTAGSGPSYYQWPWDTIKMFIEDEGGRKGSNFHHYAQNEVFFTGRKSW